MSAKTFYEKYYRDQPSWAKGIINVIVVGGTAFIGWKIYQGMKKRQAVRNAGQYPQAAATELQMLAQKGIYPSFSASQYEAYSQQMAQAMAGCGTDEDAILRIMGQLRNDADLIMLVKTFGVRAYEPCYLTNPIDHATWVFNREAFPMSLDAWFSRDLSTGNIEDINDVLKERGITYSF